MDIVRLMVMVLICKSDELTSQFSGMMQLILIEKNAMETIIYIKHNYKL